MQLNPYFKGILLGVILFGVIVFSYQNLQGENQMVAYDPLASDIPDPGLKYASATVDESRPDTPLRKEMRFINDAYLRIVQGLTLNDMQMVDIAAHEIAGSCSYDAGNDPARAKLIPPKNADKMEEFNNLDIQFHENAKVVARAARLRQDKFEAAQGAVLMLQGCIECHDKYRD